MKIFDPRDTSTGSRGVELLDSTVVQRDRQWWMYLAGQPKGFGDIFSASLAVEASLSVTGWESTRDNTGQLAPVAGQQRSKAWDGNGERHCPSYVKGWDPASGGGSNGFTTLVQPQPLGPLHNRIPGVGW